MFAAILYTYCDMIYIVAIIIILLLILFVCMFLRNCDKSKSRIASYYFGSKSNGRPTVGFLAGVHGNEPAGAIALQTLVDSGYFEKLAKNCDINIIVVPCANVYGLREDKRWTDNIFHPDLNRSFSSVVGDAPDAKEILKIFSTADLIVDFHEGWGWHRKTSRSIGSTVSPTITQDGVSLEIAEKINNALNMTITNNEHKFTLLPNISCDIRSTLSCNMEMVGRNYILIETTGQKNIQPLDVRLSQIITSIKIVCGFICR